MRLSVKLHKARIALGVAMLMLLASCGTGPVSGVNVRTISTDLVFGIPEETRPAPPAGFRPDPVEAPLGVVIDDPSPRRPLAPPPPPPPPECPAAPLDAAPEPASVFIGDSRPEEGRYQWWLEGYHDVPEVGRIPLGGLVRRQVRDVQEHSDGFSFTTVEQEVQFGSQTEVHQTFRLFEDSSVRDDGLYLTRIERHHPEGTGVFNPSPPIMYLPQPAQIGQSPIGVGVFIEQEQMDTVGVDPSTLESLRHAGTITVREHVDACGELVDTFYVSAMQEFVTATGDSFRRKYHYAVSTGMGGIIALEIVEAPCVNVDDEWNCDPEPGLSYEVGIGQVEPDPLPEED